MLCLRPWFFASVVSFTLALASGAELPGSTGAGQLDGSDASSTPVDREIQGRSPGEKRD